MIERQTMFLLMQVDESKKFKMVSQVSYFKYFKAYSIIGARGGGEKIILSSSIKLSMSRENEKTQFLSL